VAHTCLAGCGKYITWSFAICADCEEVYGRSARDWPEWLRYSWNQEQRARRRHRKNLDNIGTSYTYAEDVLEYTPDGKPFVLSNRNVNRIQMLYELSQEIELLPYFERTAFTLRMYGYSCSEISLMLDVSRQTVSRLCKKAGTQLLDCMSVS
jgi:DNA-directed RNA polymerase specialized sigma24 family protein